MSGEGKETMSGQSIQAPRGVRVPQGCRSKRMCRHLTNRTRHDQQRSSGGRCLGTELAWLVGGPQSARYNTHRNLRARDLFIVQQSSLSHRRTAPGSRTDLPKIA